MRVQCAVNNQVAEMLQEGFLLLFCLFDQHGDADDDVRLHDGLMLIVESENVGRIVLVTVAAVQFVAFLFINKADRNGSPGGSAGRPDPGGHDVFARKLREQFVL